MAIKPLDNPPPSQARTTSTGKKAGLAGIIGATAAALVLVMVPHDESGRKVDATINADGSATVKHIAGRQYLRAYLDIAGVATACDGITRGIRMGQTYTEAQCADFLEQELIVHAKGMMACSSGLRAPGRDYQRAGALNLTYNIGVGGFCTSTARQRFDAGDFRGGCDAIMRFNRITVPAAQVARYRQRGETCSQKANGGWSCTVKGLTDRRARERAVCLRGL